MTTAYPVFFTFSFMSPSSSSGSSSFSLCSGFCFVSLGSWVKTSRSPPIHSRGFHEIWYPHFFSLFRIPFRIFSCQSSSTGRIRICTIPDSSSVSLPRAESIPFIGSVSSFWYVRIGNWYDFFSFMISPRTIFRHSNILTSSVSSIKESG